MSAQIPSLTPPMDLKHMTSNTVLTRPAKHNRSTEHRLGSRSPDSIPSSPTSVHSSSSAIFERDIEPISLPSQHPRNPHRVPRAKGTEALEQSVPSVLDSAAAILGNLQDVDVAEQVAVVSPASLDTIGRVSNSGFASPIGSYRSRSPSPLGSRGAGDLFTSVLGLQIPAPSPPQVIDVDEPPTTTQEHPPTPTLKPVSPSYPPISLATSPISSPPSPIHVAKKRLSFMSYSDLLSSTPQSTQTLSSLTTCASSTEPPPHIPSISGLNIASAIQAQQQSPGSKAPSIHGFPFGPTGGITHPGKRDSIAMLDNVGGEWEKEGLGRGLEERLDALVIPPAVDSPMGSPGRVQGKAAA